MWETPAATYEQFAENEARGISDVFYDWSSRVAQDAEVLELLSHLPSGKAQPNLVFAAARFCGAPVGAYAPFREWLVERWTEVDAVVRERSTQTNEAGRCAVLLPALAQLDGPLSLIEVGASAGLCLYPDRYSYRYSTPTGTVHLDPPGGESGAILRCELTGTAAPRALPDVAWRAGVDLNPLDPDDEDDALWLRTLVWPEHDERRARLAAALRIAAADRAEIVAGDLLDVVPELIARAPKDSQIVVFHSAVLVYLEPDRRQQFASLMRGMPDVVWISNEGPRVLDRVAQQLPRPLQGRTVLAVNETPFAFVGPHGQSFDAISPNR